MKEDIEFTRTPEQWSNGLTWRWFKVDDIEYRMAHCDRDDETLIGIADPDVLVSGYRKFKDGYPFKSIQRFEGLLEPMAALRIIGMVTGYRSFGQREGYAQAQSDIRQALGIQ